QPPHYRYDQGDIIKHLVNRDCKQILINLRCNAKSNHKHYKRRKNQDEATNNPHTHYKDLLNSLYAFHRVQGNEKTYKRCNGLKKKEHVFHSRFMEKTYEQHHEIQND